MADNVQLLPAELLNRAREMRRQSVSTEQKLWQCLRDRQLGGFKFRRQHPHPPFIADFFCDQANLIVKADGDSHASSAAYDASRTRRLARDGMNVIRFANDDVHQHLYDVLEEILRECERLARPKSPSPQPSPGVPGEGEMR
jgi:very-short-patch-repair endonuclease